ncbi:MAG: hypothetical protein JKX86_07095 [Verrucomicrobiales bacterium]|nr:hypothetical protein [Verrucomicrobiales bacterium]
MARLVIIVCIAVIGILGALFLGNGVLQVLAGAGTFAMVGVGLWRSGAVFQIHSRDAARAEVVYCEVDTEVACVSTREVSVRDRLADTLERSVLVEIPPSMPYRAVSIVRVTIASRELEEAIAAVGRGLDHVYTERLPLTIRVMAELRGVPQEVEIDPETQRIKTALSDEDTIFEWSVRPLSLGKIKLILQLINVTTLDGEEFMHERPAMHHEVEVVASLRQRLESQFDRLDPLLKLVGFVAALIAIGGGAWSVWSYMSDRQDNPPANENTVAVEVSAE